MKITKKESIRENWDKVKSWNYKLDHLSPKMSVVYAELEDTHGKVSTKEIERIYYIINGQAEFIINNKKTLVKKGDVITIPPKTKYNYSPIGKEKLQVVMFMDIWEN